MNQELSFIFPRDGSDPNVSGTISDFSYKLLPDGSVDLTISKKYSIEWWDVPPTFVYPLDERTMYYPRIVHRDYNENRIRFAYSKYGADRPPYISFATVANHFVKAIKIYVLYTDRSISSLNRSPIFNFTFPVTYAHGTRVDNQGKLTYYYKPVTSKDKLLGQIVTETWSDLSNDLDWYMLHLKIYKEGNAYKVDADKTYFPGVTSIQCTDEGIVISVPDAPENSVYICCSSITGNTPGVPLNAGFYTDTSISTIDFPSSRIYLRYFTGPMSDVISDDQALSTTLAFSRVVRI